MSTPLAMLRVIVSLVSLFNLIALGSPVNLGRQSILLSLSGLAGRENIAFVAKLRRLPRTTRWIRAGSLTGRVMLSGMYRMTIRPGVGGRPRLDSMAVTHGKTRLTIMV